MNPAPAFVKLINIDNNVYNFSQHFFIEFYIFYQKNEKLLLNLNLKIFCLNCFIF